MPIPLSKDLLDDLLAGKHLTAEDLDKLVVEQPKEDQYLDYKDGALTRKDPKDAKKVVREWISAFANSDGGTLILGVSEGPPRAVSGCTRQGNAPLDEWARDLVLDMAPFFSPQPRIHVVAHPIGEVLVAAVARAPQLVPCVESRELKYFLRIHDSTVQAPTYLISDLVLGRRKHPVLDLRVREVLVREESWCKTEDDSPAHLGVHLGFSFLIESLSLEVAEDVEVGIVAWSVPDTDTGVNRHVESYVDATVRPDSRGSPLRWRLCHIKSDLVRQRPAVLRPFGQIVTPEIVSLQVPFPPPGRSAVLRCAAYTLPKGSVPTWFEMEYRYDENELAKATPRRNQGVRLTRMGVERPRVTWELQS